MSKLKLVFLKKNSWAIWNQSSYESLRENTGMKIYTNDLGHMTNMAAMPIYGRNLRKFSSPEPIDHDLETWYVASCMGVLPKVFKL